MLTDPKKSAPYHRAAAGNKHNTVQMEHVYRALNAYVASLSTAYTLENLQLFSDANLFLKELVGIGQPQTGNPKQIESLRHSLWNRHDKLMSGTRVYNNNVCPSIDLVDMQQLISSFKRDIKTAIKIGHFIELDIAQLSNNLVNWLEMANFQYEESKKYGSSNFSAVALGKLRLVNAAILHSKCFQTQIEKDARSLRANLSKSPSQVKAGVDQLLSDLRPYREAA